MTTLQINKPLVDIKPVVKPGITSDCYLEKQIVLMTVRIILLAVLLSGNCLADNFYVSTSGNNVTGDGSENSPWRTIAYALENVEAGRGHTINMSAGLFIERAPLSVGSKINLRGAGMYSTIITGTSFFYYHPPNPGFEEKRFLFQLDGPLHDDGEQTLSGFSIDGSSKRIHGGIYINGRSGIRIEDIRIEETNFCGLWILNASDVRINNVSLRNCAWGSSDWCSGAFQFAHIDNVDIDNLNIDEGTGYGIKSLGHEKDHNLNNFKLHDSRISVNPMGLWKNGKAPNIAVEIWANSFAGSEIYNCYFDNHISIVNSDHSTKPTGHKFRIHHNIFDIQSRAKGKGYGIELTIHDAEIDHNYFNGGFSGISNWSHAKENWSIHHNIFYGIASIYPTAVINVFNGNLKKVHIYNNTIELAGKSTVNFLQCANGGVSADVVIENNLIINSNTDYSHYPNRFISLEKGATIENLVVENNLLKNLPLGDLEGVVRNNHSEDPEIMAVGERPFPYYQPKSTSPLIGGGVRLRKSSYRQATIIGAYEGEEFSKPFTTD